MRLIVILGDPLNSFPLRRSLVKRRESVFSARDASIYYGVLVTVQGWDRQVVLRFSPYFSEKTSQLNSLNSLNSLNFSLFLPSIFVRRAVIPLAL